MNKKQVTELIKKAKSGDKDAMQKLCLHYDKQINSIITHCKNNYTMGILTDEDIRQDCYLGIILCLNSKVVDFAKSYYWYMLHTVKRDYYMHCTTVHISNLDEYGKDFNKTNSLYNDLIESVNCDNIKIYSNMSNNIDFIDKIDIQLEVNRLVTDMKSFLTEKQYTILCLYYIENLTLPEIAKMYNITSEAVRRHRNSALGKCRKYLGY